LLKNNSKAAPIGTARLQGWFINIGIKPMAGGAA
jgi:hypothetical protein